MLPGIRACLAIKLLYGSFSGHDGEAQVSVVWSSIRTGFRGGAAMDVRSYPSDLTDEEWALVEPLLERSHPAGRDQTYSLRRIVDAILYVLRTGVQWRYLPTTFRLPRLFSTTSASGAGTARGSASMACCANASASGVDAGPGRPLPLSTARAPGPRKREGREATMAERRSRGGSARCSSTRKATC
jgi:hypothetical protein